MIHEEVSYEQLLDNLTEGVYFVDRDRKILYWNHGAEQITGFHKSEVVSRHCWDNILLHVDAAGNSLCRGDCPLIRAIRQERPCETEAYLHHKDGHRVPVLIKTMPIRGKAGDILGAVEVFSDNSPRLQLVEKLGQLEKLSLLEPLTGLANRRYLESELAAVLNESRRYGWPCGVIFADIDNFKHVNDPYGHDTGDRVIQMVASTLRHNCRSFDKLGRWGGEEFLVVCNNVASDQLSAAAERYRMLVEASAIRLTTGSVSVTISAGATLALPDDTPASLVARADRLMYESKKAGRNRVTCG